MNITNIINDWSEEYSQDLEEKYIHAIKDVKLMNLSGQISDLLALSIMDNYNKLAKTILEKEYAGQKVNLAALNEFLMNKTEEKNSLLHYCTEFGNKEMLLYLLQNGIKITDNNKQMTPLHFLSFANKLEQKDFVEIIDILEKHQPGISKKQDGRKLTPLHYAAYYNNDKLLKALSFYATKQANDR